MSRIKIQVLLISFVLGIYPLMAQKKYDKQIDDLINKMSLDEKVGQLNQYNGFWDATGPMPEENNEKLKFEHLKQGHVGSVLNVSGAEQVRKLQQLVVENSRLGIPLLFGMDVVHGYKTAFPIPLAEAASWDLELIEKTARISAIEAASVGLNWTFAPMVDISRDARWGRVMEGAGEDTYLGTKIGVARVKGYQGNDLSDPFTIAACAKHFAAYAFTEDGKDYNTVDVGTVTLYNSIFPPFKALVDNDVKTFMNAFNVLNGVPATGSSFLQRDILKGEWGFDGFIVSDWGSIAELMVHGFANDLKQSAELAINAGCDMDMESYSYISHLKDLVIEGKVDESLIDDAVRRILKVKFELGLFDDPYLYCNQENENKYLNNPEHQQVALEMALNSIVLLKNEANLLPLHQKQSKIALIGSLANDKDSPLGNWRAHAVNGSAVSVLEGIKNITNDVTYAEGAKLALKSGHFLEALPINETDTAGFSEAVHLAANSEVVVMVLGEHCYQSGEGRSRLELGLPGVQQQLLEAVYQVNKNIVLVLMNGRPLTIPWADEHIPAIIATWHLGSQSGNAIAKVLFGEHNPSGKLPMTFPKHVGQVPIYYNHYSSGRPYHATSVCFSHYIDGSKEPLYPFGYGLSYTTFEYNDLKISTLDPDTIKVSVSITNTGNRKGAEVVQLYIRDRVASVVRPVKELKGFEKLSLKPGQTETVVFNLTHNELGFFNQNGEFIVEAGDFDVTVGPNSQIGLMDSFYLNYINQR